MICSGQGTIFVLCQTKKKKVKIKKKEKWFQQECQRIILPPPFYSWGNAAFTFSHVVHIQTKHTAACVRHEKVSKQRFLVSAIKHVSRTCTDVAPKSKQNHQHVCKGQRASTPCWSIFCAGCKGVAVGRARVEQNSWNGFERKVRSEADQRLDVPTACGNAIKTPVIPRSSGIPNLGVKDDSGCHL